MSIIQLIVWVAIIMSIVKKIKKVNGAKNSYSDQNTMKRPDGTSVRQTSVRVAKSKPAQRSANVSQADLDYRKRQEIKNRKKAGQENQAQEKSTTQLLHEKAMLDEAEHQREKRQQEIENERIHGRLRYAQRMYPGDPVPKGRRMVFCPYCNAENLVPANDFTTKYNCYFCREIL